MEIYDDGFELFSDLLKKYEEETSKDSVMKVLEIGAKEFVEDVRKLPKPISQIRAPGYTHLLDTVTYRRTSEDVVTGWGKYYGPMIENGTIRTRATPHIQPTFERNKEKYYKKMQNALFG